MAESGNGEELMVKQIPGSRFSVNQNTNCEAISYSCSLDLTLGHPDGRDSYLRASMRENCRYPSRQASNPIEPPSLPCMDIVQSQDKGDHARLGDHYHITPRLSNGSSNDFVGTDGSNKTRLTSCNTFPVSSDMKYGSPLSRECRDFSYSGHPNSSHSISPRDEASEHRTISGNYDNFVGEIYTGLCYEPLQEKDLKFFCSTGRFPSTESYIRQPSDSTTSQNPSVLEKRLYVDSSIESILRRAAMTYKNTPSIIRKRRLPTSNQASNTKHMDNILPSVEGLDSYDERLLGSNEFPSAGGGLGNILLKRAQSSKILLA